MDPRSILTTFQVEHRHSDGGFGVMVEERAHHDPADHDPERDWGEKRVFRCAGCDETISITLGGPTLAPSER